MKIALTVIAILCVFVLPVPIVWLTRKSKIIGAVGAIACCYIVGFLFSTIGLSGVDYDKGLTTTVAYVLVALSIPLILFSIDLRQLKKLTRNTTIGYALCIVSVLSVSVITFFVARNFLDATSLSAMIAGLYTGGTPNMNAIGAAMGADNSIISAANVSDTIVGGIYFLFLISIAPKLYKKLFALRNKKKAQKQEAANNDECVGGVLAASASEQCSKQTESGDTINAEEKEPSQAPANNGKTDDYSFGIDRHDKRSIFKLIGVFFLAVGCLGVGALLEFLIEGTVGNNLLYILLSVSVLGVAFSFIRPIREVKGEYNLGMYLILMFSIALSMSIDWSVFLSDILPTMLLFLCAQVGTIVLHFLLCFIAGVDGDSAIITSTAGVYGPPFIAPVAEAANRPDLIAPGVICGALGLAIGTLLGIGMGQLFILIG